MRATWRPLPAWPYPPRPKAVAPFRMDWNASLDSLEFEVAILKGDDLVIGVVCDPSQISISGALDVQAFRKTQAATR